MQVIKNSQNATNDERYVTLEKQLDKVTKESALENQLMKQRKTELLGTLAISNESAARLAEEKNQLTQTISSLEAEMMQLSRKVRHIFITLKFRVYKNLCYF